MNHSPPFAAMPRKAAVCSFQISVLAVARLVQAALLERPRDREPKKAGPGGSHLLLKVNGTAMTFCCAKAEIWLKSQKPVILRSSLTVHPFLLAKAPWIDLKLRCLEGLLSSRFLSP